MAAHLSLERRQEGSIPTHVSLYLGRDDGAALVDDGVHLLDHVEVCLVVGVLDARAAPGHVGQLARRERGAQAGAAQGDVSAGTNLPLNYLLYIPQK